jgi:hypothetical protein
MSSNDMSVLLDAAKTHLGIALIPPSDDSRPPSNLATIVLPETGDRPGSGSIGSFMAGVAFLKWR